MNPTQVKLTIPDHVDPRTLLGTNDVLLRRIEAAFDAMITVRGSTIALLGASDVVAQLTSVFSRLIACVEAGETPDVTDVDVMIRQVLHDEPHDRLRSSDVLVTHRGKPVRPRTEGQRNYVDAMRTHTITFGMGPAGTGKTYLAMAMAISALQRRDVARIVLGRPVVEAGESLGYLPGTLEEKLDPYVRPLFDALFDIVGLERATSLIERGIIEVAPLAFMRGRTLSSAFAILDEAQNTTPEQMKMFLTRLGAGSRFAITGDMTQRDLLGRSGLDVARAVLEGTEGVAFVDLGSEDIVRHELVARIVAAYAAHEAKGAGHDGRD
jgi:phosphate starvation-inducible PhoH-like protein